MSESGTQADMTRRATPHVAHKTLESPSPLTKALRLYLGLSRFSANKH
jgi:hypothetical protein